MSEQTATFDQWGIVEVMGHRSFGGRITEQTIGGTSFVRVDVPETSRQPAFSKLFGAGSIYCISPTTEELARQYQEGRGSSPPVSEYDLPDETRNAIQAGRRLIDARDVPASVPDDGRPDEYDDLIHDDFDAP